MERDTVISLCDLTGAFVAPWVAAGYRGVLVDPQHGFTSERGGVTRLASTVEEAVPQLREVLPRAAFVAGFPPCTDLAVSGARWWAAKSEEDYLFQARAVAVAEQCRMVGRLSGAPWLVENPVSALSRVWGPANYIFHPWYFTELEPADNYTKKTCLWTGGGFVGPEMQVADDAPLPDNRIHAAPPGPERANFRSATPAGFARAVFEAHQTNNPKDASP